MGTKWVIEKLTRDNNLGLWKAKMHVVLIQKKCAEALNVEVGLSATMSQTNKIEMVEKAIVSLSRAS